MQSCSWLPGCVCAECALDASMKEDTGVSGGPSVRGSGPHPWEPFPEPILHLQRAGEGVASRCRL